MHGFEDVLLSKDAEVTTVVVEMRYQGPPTSGNGGYVAGLLARHAGTDVDVWLRKPVPLDRPLALRPVSTDTLALFDGEALVAEARRAALDFALPEFVDPLTARAAREGYAGFEHHPLPGCFVCGTDRAPGDGLRVFAGPVRGRSDLVAASWTPDASLEDGSGDVWTEIVWAALDCPAAFAVGYSPGRLMLLGRMSARIVEPLRPGEAYVVTASPLGVEGRKRYATSGIYSEHGKLHAVAHTTWIELKNVAGSTAGESM